MAACWRRTQKGSDVLRERKWMGNSRIYGRLLRNLHQKTASKSKKRRIAGKRTGRKLPVLYTNPV